jgi:SAM-dependent methyltransferase
MDKSNGYEEIASIFIPGRGSAHSGIGASTMTEWSRVLPEGATVLDLGCGTGVPISQVLMRRGLQVYGVDASPSMVAAFRARFPGVPVQCASVEESDFFGRTFDAVVAWGLFFLLDPEVQRRLIAKIGPALNSGGWLLFTAHREFLSWNDAMTDRASVSLGYEAYREAIEAAGMMIVETRLDEGENHYYISRKQ